MDLFVDSRNAINGTPYDFELDTTDVYTIQEGYSMKLVGATIPTFGKNIIAGQNDLLSMTLNGLSVQDIDIVEGVYDIDEVITLLNSALDAWASTWSSPQHALYFKFGGDGVSLQVRSESKEDEARLIDYYTIDFRVAQTCSLLSQLGFTQWVQINKGTILQIPKVDIGDPERAERVAYQYPTLHPDYVDVNINIPTLTYHSNGQLSNVIARIPLSAPIRAMMSWSNFSNEVGQRIQGMNLNNLRIWLTTPNGDYYLLPDWSHTSFHFQLQRV
jgi:hypothetical protein